MRIRGLATALALAMIVPAAGRSQDILGMFVAGDTHSRIMGGDPFAVRERENGLSFGAADDSRLRVRFDFEGDNIYKESHADGTETALSRSDRRLGISFPLSGNASSGRIDLDVSSSEFSAIVNQTGSERGDFLNERKTLTMSYNTPIGDWMRAGASVGQSYPDAGSNAGYGTNVVFLLPSGISLAFGLDSWKQSQSLMLTYTGTDGILPLDFSRQGIRLSARIPLDGLTIYAGGHRDFISPVKDVARPHETRFAPSGIATGYNLNATMEAGRNWSLLFSAASEAGSGSGLFFSNDRKYGALKGYSHGMKVVSAAAKLTFPSGGLFETDLKWENLSGSLEGYAEDWPFTSVFDSPIPVRENVRAQGDFELAEFHVGTMIRVTDGITLGLGGNIFRMWPDLELDSWESKYLVFGVRGLKSRTLNIESVDGAILSAGSSVWIAPFLVEYSITQFVPIDVRRSAAGGGNPVLKSPTVVGRESGGQFHHVTVEYVF